MAIAFKRPTVYGFDPQTKEYTGPVTPDICHASLQRNELNFLSPAFTTEVAPPDTPRGSKAVWDGGSWSIVADHRGETWWAGERPVLIVDLGDPGVAGLVKEPPEPPPPPPPDPVKEKRSALFAQLSEVTAVGASFVQLKQPVPDDLVRKHAGIVAELRALD